MFLYLTILCVFAIGIDYLEMTFPLSIQYILIVLGAIVFLISVLLCRIRIKVDGYTLLILLMMFTVVYRNTTVRSYCIYILSVLPLLIYQSIGLCRFEKAVSCLGFCYIVFAAATIFLYFNEAIYMRYIVPLFPLYSREMQYCYSVGYMTGLTANYARNSSMLSIGLIIAVSQLYEKRRRNIFHYLILILYVIALVLACKRAHTLFMTITILWCLFLHMSNKPRSRWFKMAGIGIVGVLFGWILLTYNTQFAKLLGRFSNLLEDGAVQNRFAIWTLALSVISDKPLFGVGWGNFLSYTEEYLHTSWNAHNMYLQLLCETGAFGFIIFMSFIIFIYCFSVKLFVKVRRKTIILDNNAERNLLFSIGIQTFTLLYSLTGSPLTDIRIYIPYYFGCVITLCYVNLLRKNQREGQ